MDFPLDQKVSIYVPSTVDVKHAVDNTRYVDFILTSFCKMFGGASVTNITGGWQSEEHGTVKESVAIVQSSATEEQIAELLPEVVRLAQWLKVEMSQEAVSVELNGRMGFI